MAVVPAFAVVSGAALGGAARAPRPAADGGERRRGALVFRRRAPCFTPNGLRTTSLLDRFHSLPRLIDRLISPF
jgi:hypothetical protein